MNTHKKTDVSKNVVARISDSKYGDVYLNNNCMRHWINTI